MKKALAGIVVLALAGALGWQIYRRVTPQASKGAASGRGGGPAVPVEVAPVGKASVREVAHFTGSLLARSSFIVAPKTAGRLEKLMVNIGDRVSQGQLIALLDDEEYSQQEEQARAELDVARANVEEAHSALEAEEREHNRVQALLEKKIASESERDASKARYEGQQARYKVALAQVTQREAALKAAQVRRSYTRIAVSWEDGEDTRFVGERFVDEGAMLRANDPIVSVLDLGSLTAVIHAAERDYGKVRVGQTALLTSDASPGRTFSGRVVRMAPLLKEESRQARVEIEVPNPEGVLKPGMFVRAELELSRAENATVVPVSALARRDDQQGVFLADLDEQKARFVAVKTGVADAGKVQILDPALSGVVVTLGHHLLEDGAAIAVVEEGGGQPDPSAGSAERSAGTRDKASGAAR